MGVPLHPERAACRNERVADLFPSPGLWLLAPLALTGIAFALAHWRRVVIERLGRLAARRGGLLVIEPWHTTTRVEWARGGTRLTVSVRSESDDHARSGARTFAHIPGAHLPDFELELRRAEGWPHQGEPPDTRDAAFAGAFRWRTDAPRLARELLDAELRRMLLAFDVEHDVAVRLGEAGAFRGGLWRQRERERHLDVSVYGVPEETEVLEALWKLAHALHERLERAGTRRAA